MGILLLPVVQMLTDIPSHLVKGAGFSSPDDDTQATNITIFHSMAAAKAKSPDSLASDGYIYEGQQKHSLTREPVPPVFGKLLQAEAVTESSVDASRQATMTGSAHGKDPVHLYAFALHVL